jgi:5'(3')-deoxyribonucleotidase
MAANKTADIATLSSLVQKDVAVGEKEIKAFKVEDFKKENSELIEVKSKEPEVIKQIKEVSKLPAPEGRLLITRYEVYFIKNGRVEWEGKIVDPPVKEQDRIYVASEDYVFCASTEGPVYWKKEIINDGKVQVKNNTATIFVKGKAQKLDAKTGTEKM